MNNKIWVKPSTDILRFAPPLPDSDDPVVKVKRVNKKMEYKSIIRTRAQKVREALAYHDAMLNDVATFYNLTKKEPQMESSDSKEVELATYIHNLRVAPLNAEFVLRVSEAIPWFKWGSPAQKPVRRWTTCENIGMLLLTVSTGIAAATVQMYFSDPRNVRWVFNTATMLVDKLRHA